MTRKEIDDRINLACKIISAQFPGTPSGKLMFAIIERAIQDAACTPLSLKPSYKTKEAKASAVAKLQRQITEKDSAMVYLATEMEPASLCDVQSSWIRSVLRKTQVELGIN